MGVMKKQLRLTVFASVAAIAIAGCAGVGSSARNNGCAVIERERFDAFFFDQKVRPQPVYVNGELYGWRVYEQVDSKVLPQLGLRVGDLVTHFCGVKLPEIVNGNGKFCCGSPLTDTVVLTVERDRQSMQIPAPMPPNYAFKADVSERTRP